ncbi:lysostaphin resistance A-like protein [Myxococcota bacterium]
MWRVWVLVAGAAVAQGVALRGAWSGTPAFWFSLGLAYTLLAAIALDGLRRVNTLADRLRPRWGDLSMGTAVTVVLLLGCWAGRSLLTPLGSAQHAWLLRLYLQLGDSNTIQRSVPITLTVLWLAVADEIVWRGYVLDTLTERVGARGAFLYATLLYGAAALPSVVTLYDPVAGPNPLWVLLTLGTGLFWSLQARLTGRLLPGMISHMVFSYFSAVQPRLPGVFT